ncbi:MAG: hypothetical protein JO291_05510 [Acidimicrobiia bacterium]|nr:hypothetical protein [Acidimicrobiia bacterium]
MEPEPHLTALLERLVERCDPAVIDAGAIVRRAQRQRARRAAALVIVVALAMGGAVIAAHDGRPEHVTTNPPTTAAATTTVPSMGATEVATGRWSTTTAPAALRSRAGALVVWAGDRLVVWGGDDVGSHRHLSDGETFDPRSGRWTPMAEGPLAATDGGTAVWSGELVYVLGSDGIAATYDPVADRWHALWQAPVSGRVVAVWTGTEVVVVGTDDHVAALRPGNHGNNRWHRLPDVPFTGVVDQLAAVWSRGRVVVARAGSHLVERGSGAPGLRFAALDPRTGRWVTRFEGPAPTGLTTMFPTAGGVLVPGAVPYCPAAASCPFEDPGPGAELDLATGAWTHIARGPADDAHGLDAWTGAALLHVSASAESGARHLRVGQAAIWDAAGNRWVPVADGPATEAAAAVWTGREVLVWDESDADDGADVLRRFGP